MVAILPLVPGGEGEEEGHSTERVDNRKEGEERAQHRGWQIVEDESVHGSGDDHIWRELGMSPYHQLVNAALGRCAALQAIHPYLPAGENNENKQLTHYMTAKSMSSKEISVKNLKTKDLQRPAFTNWYIPYSQLRIVKEQSSCEMFANCFYIQNSSFEESRGGRGWREVIVVVGVTAGQN
jgi:hypothetical protein